MAFHRVAPAADVGPGTMKTAKVDRRRRVLLVNADGTIRAFEPDCTHAKCSLGEGALREMSIICLCHGSWFDARTGAVMRPPAPRALRTYPVEIRFGDVYVDLPDA